MDNSSKTAGRLRAGVVTIILLSVCLCVTTAALAFVTVRVENNRFHTGEVQINLNDGEPIIREYELLFEPGMTVERSFFIENESTADVYYRIFLDNVSGGLAEVLLVTIKDGDKVLYAGTAEDMSRENTKAADDILKFGQRRDLTVLFRFPPDKGNEAQGLDLSFTICAEATQTQNNPDRLFD